MSAWGGSEQEPLALALHGSEIRTLTLTYGSGNFIFEILEALKKYWAKDEQIHIHYKVKNNGNTPSVATIDIFDGTTKLVTWTTSSLAPGYSYDVPDATDYRLKMPDHDWSLRLELKP